MYGLEAFERFCVAVQPVSVRSAATAVANAGGGTTVTVTGSCDQPHCQQIAARLNQTALAVVTGG